MYETRNIQARSGNHCCRGKAVSIKYYECVSIALVIRHAKCMCRIILSSVWPVWLYHVFPHYLVNVCFYLLYNFCLKHFSF
jgi:hypothetical protein